MIFKISLIIPAYNEEESIERTLKDCDAYLKAISKDYEIIVVNDGSFDKTAKIIDECACRNPAIRPLHNTRNEGSGKSLFIGLKKAQYDFIVTNFADLPFDMKELPQVLSLFEDNFTDFVVVVRNSRRANTFYRKITSLTNYWLIRLLFRVNIGDFQFVQAYRKRVIDEINVSARGTFVPAELMIKAVRKDFSFKEYKTDFYPRKTGKAKCGSPKVIFQTIYEMVRFWFLECLEKSK